MKRIVILTQYYPPESGAPAIRLSSMARELVKLGFDVRVLTGMPNYPSGRIAKGYEQKWTMREQIEGIPVRRSWLYAAAGRGALKRIANYLSFTATASLSLWTERDIDLVFVEAQPITLALPAFLRKLVVGTPYIYNTPDLQVEYATEDRWAGRALVGGARALEAFLMKQAASVTTVTHAFIEHFVAARGVPLERMSFLPNGADTERLRPLPRDTAFAAELGVGDRKVFTYAGTMAPYQGLETLVDTAKRLQHRKDIVFLMVGNGPVRDKLVAAAEGLPNLLFRDSPFSDMQRLMSVTEASLVVLRGMQIARKMRLSKAIPPMACGVPVIYAGWGETAEIVSRERVGLTTAPEDPQALAQAIEQIADDPALRRDLGANGRALAEREFSWQFIVGDWVRQVQRIQEGLPPMVPGLGASAGTSPAAATGR